MVSSPLKHVLRTGSDDSWPLIEFTPCEKQKYQVTFVAKNKKYLVAFSYYELTNCFNLKAHLVRN